MAATAFLALPLRGRWSTRGLWLFRRLLAGAAMLLIVSMLIFAATQALPGDVAQMVLGKEASPEQLAVVRERLHVDAPLPVQYWAWLRGVLAGAPGQSLVTGLPVWDMMAQRVVNSFTIVILSTALALPTGILLGAASARNRDGGLDRVLLALSMAVNALPEFVLAMLLVVVFSISVVHWLPAVSVLTPGVPLWRQGEALVLPVATMFLLQATYLYRLVRASLIDVLDSEYIELAVLKGLPARRVLLRHALPNAIVPAVQATATIFAYSVGGLVVVEYVFGFPGIGTALTDAVGNRDVPVVQFVVVLIAATFFVANLVADVLALALSPPGRSGPG